MVKDGKDSFYQIHGGKKMCYDLSHKIYQVLPNQEAFIVLDYIRDQSVISKNSEAVIHDIGDGVLCVEFTSKSNAIGQGTGEAMNEAIEKAEQEGWNGVVIGNDANNFSVGANLMNVGMMAMQKQFDALNEMINGFQQLTMRLRYSGIPVVAATQGYVFGGGCEIAMHCDAVAASPESYVGLVEVGVGLLPGGGGCKEMALRASNKFFEGDVQMPTLQEHFRPIATASVSTSAVEAYDYNLFDPNKDAISINGARRIAEAKKKVLQLADGYTQPLMDEVTVLGRGGLAMLYTAINEFRLGNYMSDYDVEIAKKVAFVLCGGDLTSSQKVSQQYLLDLEREGFLSLLGNQKTLDRIQHMLTTNKPLRN
jgi:3-hydroxyacyl-CoA dehydrogenase